MSQTVELHVPSPENNPPNQGLAEFGSEASTGASAVHPVSAHTRPKGRRAAAAVTAIAAVAIGMVVAIPRFTSLAFPATAATGPSRAQSGPPAGDVPLDAVPPVPSIASVADARGSLQVIMEPGPATVEVDGIDRGVSPISLGDLAAGEHAVVVRGERGEHRRTVSVEPGSRTSLVISITPAEATFGWLGPAADLPLRILEYGRVIGTTEASRTMLRVGRHELEFVAAEYGFRDLRVVYIAPDRVTPVAITLPRVALNIEATPWAEVFLDGLRLGETPLVGMTATLGRHELEFRHPELGRKTMPLRVSLSEPARVMVDMRTP